MPIKKRLDKARKLDGQHVEQFITGLPLLAGTGWSEGIGTGGCGTWSTADWAEYDAAVKAGWHQHGAAVLRWWRRETEQFTPMFGNDPRKAGEVPWALERFGRPEDAPCQ